VRADDDQRHDRGEHDQRGLRLAGGELAERRRDPGEGTGGGDDGGTVAGAGRRPVRLLTPIERAAFLALSASKDALLALGGRKSTRSDGMLGP
jgi:hypothetical protein